MIYKNDALNEICFPLGGIGTGCIGLTGNGMLKDWEIFNRPAKGTINEFTHIAVKAIGKDKKYFKILNGDHTKDLTGQYIKTQFEGFGYGPSKKIMCGFPHFSNCEFKGEFPIAKIIFSDPQFPGKVELTAYNPFIPLDYKNSSIPAAFFEVKFINDTDDDFEYHAVMSVANPFEKSTNTEINDDNIISIKMYNPELDENSIEYGDMTLSTINNNTFAQEYWYRGQWCDSVVTYWNEFTERSTKQKRSYKDAGSKDMCSLESFEEIKAHSEKSIRFVLSWNFPNACNYWVPIKDENDNYKTWRNYYATVFKSSVESGHYSIKNWDMLYSRTKLFKDTLFSSTLDEAVIDAVSATMSVLKSPTVLRLENGELYGWEGVHEMRGSCEGTCQHVWNYAYAACFLFPELERSIKNLELKYSTAENGAMRFRLALPLGENYPQEAMIQFSCLDGQMGFIIKFYRDWKLSGNSEWLKENWNKIKKILEFAWHPENSHEWDKDKDGVLEGRQHHTLDMELFGPSSWLEGFYLAALKAASEMAEYLGDTEKAEEYKNIYEKGQKWTKENLFNGEYFIQKIDLNDKSIVEHFDCLNYWNDETNEMKYQIGEGSEIDQLCAQWHANICGLGYIFDKEQVKIAVKNMYKNNFKPSMREFANPWRIFSLNDDAGAVICDYPEGKHKPFIPIPYCEETMHGFEYQMAGLLISEGMIDEGINIVKSVRARYAGFNRNPWNEIECGSNYARSMASFALLPIFSGFVFDLPNKKIGFNPIINKKNFKCLWSLDTAWGYVEINEHEVIIKINEGNLEINKIYLPFIEKTIDLLIDGKNIEVLLENGTLIFETQNIKDSIIINY